jgi:hypothetical protein
MCSSFFRFGVGRPLHNVHSTIPHNPLEVPTTCFAIFPLKISDMIFLSVPPFPRYNRCPELHPPLSFVVDLSFLRHSGRLPPRSLIRLLPRSCCLRPRSLMPLLHSGPFQRLSRTSVLSGFLVPHCPSCISCDRVPCAVPLSHGGSSLRSTANFFRGP